MTRANDGGAFLRPKQVAARLGVSKDTVRRIGASDPAFPRWVRLSAGIRVMRAAELDRWLYRKESEARLSAPV